jgi:hypothetical protein
VWWLPLRGHFLLALVQVNQVRQSLILMPGLCLIRHCYRGFAMCARLRLRLRIAVFFRRVEDSMTAAATGRNPLTHGSRIRYGVEIRACDLGAALRCDQLGEGEHLLRPGGTAGDSFVSLDRIFERYRVDSRRFQNVRLKALAEFVSNYGYVVRSKLHAVHAD